MTGERDKMCNTKRLAPYRNEVSCTGVVVKKAGKSLIIKDWKK